MLRLRRDKAACVRSHRARAGRCRERRGSWERQKQHAALQTQYNYANVYCLVRRSGGDLFIRARGEGTPCIRGAPLPALTTKSLQTFGRAAQPAAEGSDGDKGGI